MPLSVRTSVPHASALYIQRIRSIPRTPPTLEEPLEWFQQGWFLSPLSLKPVDHVNEAVSKFCEPRWEACARQQSPSSANVVDRRA